MTSEQLFTFTSDSCHPSHMAHPTLLQVQALHGTAQHTGYDGARRETPLTSLQLGLTGMEALRERMCSFAFLSTGAGGRFFPLGVKVAALLRAAGGGTIFPPLLTSFLQHLESEWVSSKFLVFLWNPGTELVSEAGKTHCPVLYENCLAHPAQQLVLPDPQCLLNCKSHPGPPEGCLWLGEWVHFELSDLTVQVDLNKATQ